MTISGQNVNRVPRSGIKPSQAGQLSPSKSKAGQSGSRHKRGPAAIVSVGEGGGAQGTKKSTSNADVSNATGTQELTKEEKKEVQELEKRDRKVRQHEQAHVQAGGQYVKGGPTYEYERGPDGKRYAVSGEVQLDTSEADDPKKTIEKMRAVKRAALAPAEPSQQDKQVASEAQKKIQEARQKLRESEQGKKGESAQGETFSANNANSRSKQREMTPKGKPENSSSDVSPAISADLTTSTRTGLQNLRVDHLAS